MPEAQEVAGNTRVGMDKERQEVDLGVPEVVAVVPTAREPLRGDALAIGPERCLGKLEEVPKDPKARLEWLKSQRDQSVPEAWKASLRKWYGDKASSIKNVEAYEITEYGSQCASWMKSGARSRTSLSRSKTQR